MDFCLALDGLFSNLTHGVVSDHSHRGVDLSRESLRGGANAVEPLLKQGELCHQEGGVNPQGGKFLKNLH